MTKQQNEKDKLLGVQARNAGKKRDANPFRSAPSLRDRANAWDEGFTEADMDRKKGKPW